MSSFGCIPLLASCVLVVTACTKQRSVADAAPTAPGAAPQAVEPDAGAPAPKASGDAAADVDPLVAELEAIADEEHEGPAVKTIAGCNDLRGAKDCTGVGATMLLCTAVGNVLSEAATKTLVACLTRKQGTDELCHAKVIEPCALEAIDGATVLPAVRAACGEIFSKCVIPSDLADAFTLERCRHGLSAARQGSRTAFIDCMKKRCDLRLCIGQLL